MLGLGYDGNLYILAFDHRGSFQKKFFGVQGTPTPEEARASPTPRRVIYEGFQGALEGGVLASPPASWWTSSSAARSRSEGRGAPEVRDAGGEVRAERVRLPVRRRVRRATSRTSIPRSTRCWCATTPRATAAERAADGRLKELADWLHEHDRTFLFELLVPAEPHSSRPWAATRARYDVELRPGPDAAGDRASCRRRASSRTSGRSRASTAARTARRSPRSPAAARAARASCAWSSGGAPTTPRWTTGCARRRACPATWASRSAGRSGGTR